MGRISEDEEDCDELEEERRSGVPIVEGEADGEVSRLLFSFLKCSSRICISFSSTIPDGTWPSLISSCSFGREANPAANLDYTETRRGRRAHPWPASGMLSVIAT